MRIVLLFMLMLAVGRGPAKADMCITTFEADTARAAAIFIGRVISYIPGNFRVEGRTAYDQYNFVIERSFKGLEPYQSVISIIAPFGGCCGSFRTDSTYLVFAYRNGGYSSFYYTNDCSMTEKLSGSEGLLARLPAPLIHEQPQRSDLDNLLHIRYESEADSVRAALLTLAGNEEKQRQALRLYQAACAGLVIILAVIIFRQRREKRKRKNFYY